MEQLRKTILGSASFVVLSMLVFASCSPQPPRANQASPQAAATPSAASAPRQEAAPAQAAPTLQTALVTFLSGKVTVEVGASTVDAELGELVPIAASVATDKDSQCDLQFGSLGTLRIKESTKVKLREIAVSETRRVASTTLLEGSVAAKVSKLAGKDRFNVATQQTVCGVRGTEFMVSITEAGQTKVSVKEGAVALLPPVFDPAAIESKALGSAIAPAVDAVFHAMLDFAPSVGASQESTIGTVDLAKASAAYVAIAANLDQEVSKAVAEEAAQASATASEASQASPAEGQPAAKSLPGATESAPPIAPTASSSPAPLNVDQFLQSSSIQSSLAAYSTSGAGLVKKVKAATKETIKELDTFATMAIYQVPDAASSPSVSPSVEGAKQPPAAASPNAAPSAPSSTPSTSAAPSPIVLAPVMVSCIPKDGDIYFDDQRAGAGSASALRPLGSLIKVTVKARGYETLTVEVRVENQAGVNKLLQLTATPGAPTSTGPVEQPKAAQAPVSAQAQVPATTQAPVSAPAQAPTSIAASPPPQEAPPAPVAAKIPEARYAISVNPSGAAVSIKGGTAQPGPSQGIFPSSAPLDYTVSLEGYESVSGSISPKPGETVALKIELIAKPVFALFKSGGAKPVGSCLGLPDGAIFVDAAGEAMRVSTRGLVWKSATGNQLAENASPALGNGLVYVEGDKNLSIISLADGAIVATIPLGESDSGLFGRRPAIVGNELFLSASDGMRVLDASSGKALRSLPMADGSDMTPTFDSGSIFVTDRKGKFYSLSPKDGTPRYATPSKAVQPVALSTTVSGGSAYFADRKGLVIAVDLSTGRLLWAKAADPSIKSIFDDLVVAGPSIWCYSKGTVVALSLATGDRIGKPIVGAAAPPFSAQGLAWVPMKDGRLVSYEPSSGQAGKSLKAGGMFSARPVESRGLFICPLADGTVAVLNPAAAK